MSEEILNLLRGATTVLAMLAFLGVVAWAWSRRRDGEFSRAAQLPLEEDDGVLPRNPDTLSSRGASDREST
jgi:cytochrome c oxidase cbb3-type subunit 4